MSRKLDTSSLSQTIPLIGNPKSGLYNINLTVQLRNRGRGHASFPLVGVIIPSDPILLSNYVPCPTLSRHVVLQ